MRRRWMLLWSVGWAALIIAALLSRWWPLLVLGVLMGPLIAAVTGSWWPVLTPGVVFGAGLLVGIAWPTDDAECFCEPVASSVVAFIAAMVWLGLAVIYAVGWVAQWLAVDADQRSGVAARTLG